MPRALYGYEVESPLGFTLLRSGAGERGRLIIEPTSEEELIGRAGELVWWSEVDGSRYVLANVPGGTLGWCSTSGAYLTEPAAARLRVVRQGSQENWEHRLGAVMAPLLLAGRGDLSLHAATIETEAGALVVCGPSGRGKSTLAAALATAGAAIASEDGTVISDLDTAPRAWPGLTGVRLTGPAMRALGVPSVNGGPENKARRLLTHDGAESGSRPIPVGAVLVLRQRGGSAVSIRPLDPIDALPAVMPSAIYAGPPALEQTLNLAARLLERIPAYEVRLPDDLTALGRAAATLLGMAGRVRSAA